MSVDQTGTFRLTFVTGDTELPIPSVTAILARFQAGPVWDGATIAPAHDQFPFLHVEWHEGKGFVVQCYEDESSWSDFLVTGPPCGPPTVEGFLIGAVQAVRPDFNGPPTDPPPLEFQLADPDRLHKELSAAGLKDVRVETITETTEHKTGKDLWEWLAWSNPIVERVLGGMLNLTNDERGAVQQTLDKMVRERAGDSDAAKLTNPVNIGVGAK